ncbi:quinol dehydrogenase membrane component [Coriobacteriaceae bacterium CHKCI002]|nr:quinol dehydrogenase membrane component [Coriobacteriaceae bacterium CHKCI002]
MKKPKAATLRVQSALGVVALVCVGLAFHTGTGTPSSFGVVSVAALCPLGGLEAMIASKTVVPPLLIGVGIVVALTLVLGRAFCAWGCPVPLLRRVFGGKKAVEKRARPASGDAEEPKGQKRNLKKACGGCSEGVAGDSRMWVLGGAVIATASFGFPVFCLVCPVGLTFGTLVVVWRVFQFNEVTWSLVVFPAILVLELVVLRKWCHRFCPLGALLSLISRGNRTLRPKVNAVACLHAAGKESCRRCVDACAEGINLHDAHLSASPSECTKCRECADACPAHAITFPFLDSRKEDDAK